MKTEFMATPVRSLQFVPPSIEGAASVVDLAAILGRKLTAYIGGAKSLTDVARATVESGSDGAVSVRLRAGLQVANTLTPFEDKSVVQAWFIGLNPDLNDRAPIQVLRDDDPASGLPRLLSAARSFVARG